MSTSERTKDAKLRELIQSPGPCITLALPGTAAGAARAEWATALDTVREKLTDRGAMSEELLAPISEAASRVPGGANGHRAVVVLRSPAVFEMLEVESVRPLVRVDDRFDLRTLLFALESVQKSFHIVALSQKRTRILKCTRAGCEEVPFPEGFPTSLADAMQTRQPDHNLKNRVTGGVSMGTGGVMFGTSSDMDDKDEYMLHFFMEIDKAVNVALKGQTDPVIPAGVEHEIALYRRVNTHPQFLEPGIHGAPDGLDGGELNRRALALLKERSEQPGEAPADFDKRVGSGHASTNIQEIVVAAFQGRVSHLYLQAASQYLGTYDPVRQRVKRTDDPLDSPIDLIEAAAYETMTHGGIAKLRPASAMPNGVPVCALFRYAPGPSSSDSETVEATT